MSKPFHITKKTRFIPRMIWCAAKLCPVGCKVCNCQRCVDLVGYADPTLVSFFDRNVVAYSRARVGLPRVAV
jgi:hypothetical protein